MRTEPETGCFYTAILQKISSHSKLKYIPVTKSNRVIADGEA